MTTPIRSQRWDTLGLKRPPAPENMPKEPRIADILLFGLGALDPLDPVDTILEQVADEIAIIGDMTIEDGPGLLLLGWARRIRTAIRLLQRSEAREPLGDDERDTVIPPGDDSAGETGGDR